MEFEKATLCQKYSQLSHLFERCDESLPFKYWIPSFLPPPRGADGWGGLVPALRSHDAERGASERQLAESLDQG